MDGWGAHWARGDDDRIRQVKAPGHGVARCCYVDFLNTGPGVAGTLRRQVSTLGSVRRVSNVAVTEIVVHDGRAVGAVGMDVVSGDGGHLRRQGGHPGRGRPHQDLPPEQRVHQHGR